MSRLPKFSKDSSYKRRGGSAEWVVLECSSCKEDICFYQKDGPGNLHRLYLDRIADSDAERPFRDLKENEIQRLSCFACNSVVASPMTYMKDTKPRTALRLVDAGVDKISIKNERDWLQHKISLARTMASIVLNRPSDE